MSSKPVAFLLADLGVTKTHSRPYTSTDNPYSRSAVQDAEVPARVPRPVRLDRARPRVLPRLLRLVQPRPPPLRDRPDDPGRRPLRPGASSSTPRARVLDAAYARHPERFVRRHPPRPRCRPPPGSTSRRRCRRSLKSNAKRLTELDRLRLSADRGREDGCRAIHSLPSGRSGAPKINWHALRFVIHMLGRRLGAPLLQWLQRENGRDAYEPPARNGRSSLHGATSGRFKVATRGYSPPVTHNPGRVSDSTGSDTPDYRLHRSYIAILWTIGIILLVIGLILALMGMMGRAVGGRAHYY